MGNYELWVPRMGGSSVAAGAFVAPEGIWYYESCMVVLVLAKHGVCQPVAAVSMALVS